MYCAKRERERYENTFCTVVVVVVVVVVVEVNLREEYNKFENIPFLIYSYVDPNSTPRAKVKIRKIEK